MPYRNPSPKFEGLSITRHRKAEPLYLCQRAVRRHFVIRPICSLPLASTGQRRRMNFHLCRDFTKRATIQRHDGDYFADGHELRDTTVEYDFSGEQALPVDIKSV